MTRTMLGVDEAGRGPLAGPVAVGVVAAPERCDILRHFPGLDDSKKLSPQKREELYRTLCRLEKEKTLRYIVVFSSAKAIDAVGIKRAIEAAVHRGVRALAPEPRGARVLLDGLLSAPPEYEQKTIIGGDGTEPLIMLASIAAKVRRDHLMRRLHARFPAYGFAAHKGYGTAAHYAALRRVGFCPAHRRSFCKNLA